MVAPMTTRQPTTAIRYSAHIGRCGKRNRARRCRPLVEAENDAHAGEPAIAQLAVAPIEPCGPPPISANRSSSGAIVWPVVTSHAAPRQKN